MKTSTSYSQNPPLFHRINPTIERLGISRTTLYRLVEAGELELIHLGPNSRGIPHDSLVKFCAARGIKEAV
ncbi:MAG TPA: type IV toxin-antitoxin system AbiEi family antitoxin domain-containing protein [Aromatoleum sp.]|uniref:helix-turn-helix transcriptional regulator n=1 Tax=Aromatoleum sp. TaxID=2307007 RepID=UPI002B47E65F|nr:type IV toxin-antitoxin system AbiEi family antitoxin domain-containing protein [Aromatoleum sp.]HJV26862.1 type IV toxin-antitoxin system AbiEi family antitoxin domain-containing protein [Aromatoleum sp.]